MFPITGISNVSGQIIKLDLPMKSESSPILTVLKSSGWAVDD